MPYAEYHWEYRNEKWEKKHKKWIILSWLVLIACGIYCAWQGVAHIFGIN